MTKLLGGVGLGFFIPATVLSAVSVVGLPLLLVTIPGIVISGILAIAGV
ncbi:MAG: hypothetical protein FWH55_08970 [Oscillospiraceae bacterium]|nr:hypothetical protein [Oscillospiraceae bacterium]